MPTLLLVFVRKQNYVFVSYERICTKTKFRFTLYMHEIHAGEFGWKPFSISELNIWLISHFSTHVLLNFYFNLYWNICILIFNTFKKNHKYLTKSNSPALRWKPRLFSYAEKRSFHGQNTCIQKIPYTENVITQYKIEILFGMLNSLFTPFIEYKFSQTDFGKHLRSCIF